MAVEEDVLFKLKRRSARATSVCACSRAFLLGTSPIVHDFKPQISSPASQSIIGRHLHLHASDTIEEALDYQITVFCILSKLSSTAGSADPSALSPFLQTLQTRHCLQNNKHCLNEILAQVMDGVMHHSVAD